MNNYATVNASDDASDRHQTDDRTARALADIIADELNTRAAYFSAINRIL